MTLPLLRWLPTFDPLIAEAKRRMRRRRSWLAVLVVLIVGACSLGVLLASRPPAVPNGIARLGLTHGPRFDRAAGWYVGSARPHACPGVSRKRCVQAEAWASTVRYRDCADCSPPHETLAALPRNGIIIQLRDARERSVYGPLGSWPPRELHASQVIGGFEGEPPGAHIGHIPLMVRGRDGTEHFLFVWFGRTHPTAPQLARATAELRTVRP